MRGFEVIEQLQRQRWEVVNLPGTPYSTLSKKGHWSFDLPFHADEYVSPKWLEWLFVVVGLKARISDLHAHTHEPEGRKARPTQSVVRDINPDVSSLTYTKPTGVKVRGRRTTVRSWAALIREAGSICARSGNRLPSAISAEQRSPYSSRTARSLRRPHDVGHGWFVETNMEAERAGEFVRLLLRASGLTTGDVTVEIRHVHCDWKATLRL